jgi:hypothetical protein
MVTVAHPGWVSSRNHLVSDGPHSAAGGVGSEECRVGSCESRALVRAKRPQAEPGGREPEIADGSSIPHSVDEFIHGPGERVINFSMYLI